MCRGLTSARDARGGSIAARVVLCLLALVLLMADPLEAVEEIHLPLPPPIQGALAAGPYNFQFTGEDNFRLTVFNSCAGVRVAVHYRTAPTTTTTQVNKQELTPTTDRLGTVLEFAVGSGYLLNATVFAVSGAPTIGCTFVKLQVIRGFGASAIVMGTVVQGYITANQDRAWPGSPIDDSLGVMPAVRLLSGTQPPVTTEIAETVPPGARWEVLTMRTPFSASAVVATRRPLLVFDDGATVAARIPSAHTVTAGTAPNFDWVQGFSIDTAFDPASPIQGLPSGLQLPAGYRVRTSTQNLQAGDQYGVPILHVREWLEVD